MAGRLNAAVRQGTHGQVAINIDGTLTYTPDANFFGEDTFSYAIEDGHGGSDAATVMVRFRDLTQAEIENYLRADQPYDCAGSAKAEALGIALMAAIHSDDPTALIGLPLIRTCALLRQAGLDPLSA